MIANTIIVAQRVSMVAVAWIINCPTASGVSVAIVPTSCTNSSTVSSAAGNGESIKSLSMTMSHILAKCIATISVTMSASGVYAPR